MAYIVYNMASWLINWPGALGFYLQPITLLHYDNYTLEPHAVTAGALPSAQENEQKLLVLPYVKGISKKIRLVCRPLNIKTAFRSSLTLRSLSTHVKAPTPSGEQKYVVYRVPCECG